MQIRRAGFVVLTFVLTVPVMSSLALDTPKKDPVKTTSKTTSKSSTATTTGGSKTDAKKDTKAPATKTSAPAKSPK